MKNLNYFLVGGKKIFFELLQKGTIRFYFEKKAPTDLIELNETKDSSCYEFNQDFLRYGKFSILKDGTELVLKKDNQVISKLSFSEKSVSFIFEDDFYVYGLGDKMNTLEKKGYSYINWSTDDYHHQDEQFKSLYKSINYLLINRGNSYFSLFFPSTYPLKFDLGKEKNDIVKIESEYVVPDFYLFLGENVKEITSNYSYLVGYPIFIRYKMLGNNQSRFTYMNKNELNEVVENFEKHKIPLDYIHLDIHHLKDFKNCTIDEERYPDFKNFSDKCKQNGVEFVSIHDAGEKVEKGFETFEYLSKNKLVGYLDGKEYHNDVWCGESVFPNYFDKKLRDYKQQIMSNYMEKYGISGIWCDMNEPASFNGELPKEVDFSTKNRKLLNIEGHNLYGEMMVRSFGDVFRSKNLRPYMFSRSGFATTAKYCFFWNGDNASLWHHLKLSLPQVLNSSISGYMFNGVDIGGFNDDVTKQLLIRFLEANLFSPFMRNHSSYGTTRQEPYAFDEETTSIYRKMLSIRYSLLPYLYTLTHFMSTKGELIVSPLFYNYPFDEEVKLISDQYMVGDSLLVAPIVDKDSYKRIVYFPTGKWIDFFNGKTYIGPCSTIIDMPLDYVGIFVKENSILTTVDSVLHIDKNAQKVLKINVYGESGKTYLYDDDGISLDYEKDIYSLYEISFKNGFFSIKSLQNRYKSSFQKIELYINGKLIKEIPFECNLSVKVGH